MEIALTELKANKGRISDHTARTIGLNHFRIGNDQLDSATNLDREVQKIPKIVRNLPHKR